MHDGQVDDIVDDMDRIVPRIYVSLHNRQYYHQEHMIEVGAKINNKPKTILVEFGANHSYIEPKCLKE